jgi:hypothetical protein
MAGGVVQEAELRRLHVDVSLARLRNLTFSRGAGRRLPRCSAL